RQADQKRLPFGDRLALCEPPRGEERVLVAVQGVGVVVEQPIDRPPDGRAVFRQDGGPVGHVAWTSLSTLLVAGGGARVTTDLRPEREGHLAQTATPDYPAARATAGVPGVVTIPEDHTDDTRPACLRRAQRLFRGAPPRHRTHRRVERPDALRVRYPPVGWRPPDRLHQRLHLLPRPADRPNPVAQPDERLRQRGADGAGVDTRAGHAGHAAAGRRRGRR